MVSSQDPNRGDPTSVKTQDYVGTTFRIPEPQNSPPRQGVRGESNTVQACFSAARMQRDSCHGLLDAARTYALKILSSNGRLARSCLVGETPSLAYAVL